MKYHFYNDIFTEKNDMIERNKGNTKELGLQLNLDANEVSKFRKALIRILERVEVQGFGRCYPKEE
mgnify:CR=1 FL=1